MIVEVRAHHRSSGIVDEIGFTLMSSPRLVIVQNLTFMSNIWAMNFGFVSSITYSKERKYHKSCVYMAI